MNTQNTFEAFKPASSSSSGLGAAEYLKDASASLKNTGKFEISITDGPHDGASLILEHGTVMVGSGKNNDIVLFGSGISENHFEIELPKAMMKKPRVIPVGGSVILQDGARVEVGQYADIEAGSEITFGENALQISRIGDPKKFVKPGLRLMAVACLFMMVPIGYGLLSNAAVGIADASSRAITSLGSTVEQTSRRYLGTSVGLSTGTNNDVKDAYTWSVKAQLEDLKLNHRLRANATPDGSIRVFGSVSDRELPRWTNFLQWYDTKTNFPPLIRDVNRDDVNRDLPSIKSVWLDEKPTVFFKDGSVGNVGSSVKGGWKIVSIDQTNVMIERDGATISLTY